jgi:hypothetical protein
MAYRSPGMEVDVTGLLRGHSSAIMARIMLKYGLIMAQKFRWCHKLPLPPRTPGVPGTGGHASPVLGSGWESAENQLRGLASNRASQNEAPGLTE